LLAPLSILVLAALPVSRILHLQRAAALAAISAMICTAVLACVSHVVARVRSSRRNAAARRKLRGR
jgi:hypothetical protein